MPNLLSAFLLWVYCGGIFGYWFARAKRRGSTVALIGAIFWPVALGFVIGTLVARREIAIDDKLA